MSQIVTFKIMSSDGSPDENLTLVAENLNGELQPSGVPVNENQTGDTDSEYFMLYSDKYAANIKRGYQVMTVDSEGQTINTYKIIDVDDYGDQLDLKLRLES